jgi:hypothetical protein
MRAVVFASVGLLVLSASAVVRGDPEDQETKDRVARLLRQLGHDHFARREQASRDLEATGPVALPALRKASSESQDAEVRRRAETLVLRIEQRLARINVKSVPPPKGAIVLFDGKNLDAWVHREAASEPTWELLGTGAMAARDADIRTRQRFAGAYRLHVEFRIPPNLADTPHGRGNSGVYLHGRYEVQILDSYGPQAPGAIHSAPAQSCGAIFGEVAPLVNACKAPGYWQSYDIDFRPPRYVQGIRDEHPIVTVYHNGVLIHDRVAITSEDTGQGLQTEPSLPGPIMLQYHGSPVQFRNIWLLPLAEKR